MGHPIPYKPLARSLWLRQNVFYSVQGGRGHRWHASHRIFFSLSPSSAFAINQCGLNSPLSKRIYAITFVSPLLRLITLHFQFE